MLSGFWMSEFFSSFKIGGDDDVVDLGFAFAPFVDQHSERILLVLKEKIKSH